MFSVKAIFMDYWVLNIIYIIPRNEEMSTGTIKRNKARRNYFIVRPEGELNGVYNKNMLCFNFCE